MSESVKKLVNRFIKKHSILNVTYPVLSNVVERLGYTIIEFNNVLNDRDVEKIVQNLNLEAAVLQSRGFTYVDEKYRLLFINEDLNEEEKLYVISHELGHIVCEHYTTSAIIGRDVKAEREANEFSHYLLKQSSLRRLKASVAKRKRIVSVFCFVFVAITILAVTGFAVKKERSYYGEFYITSSGNKYHQPECVHIKNNNNNRRLSKEEFNTGGYEPCGTCLPQG